MHFANKKGRILVAVRLPRPFWPFSKLESALDARRAVEKIS
jgi:hypothetical protein